LDGKKVEKKVDLLVVSLVCWTVDYWVVSRGETMVVLLER
jgi:hypothetical protein